MITKIKKILLILDKYPGIIFLFFALLLNHFLWSLDEKLEKERMIRLHKEHQYCYNCHKYLFNKNNY